MRIALTLLQLLVFLTGFSQQENRISIEGNIVDNLSINALENVKVILLDNIGQNHLTFSNMEGYFIFDSIKNEGNYILKFSKIGLFDFEINFEVKNDTSVFVVMDKLPYLIDYLPMIFFAENDYKIAPDFIDSLKLIVKEINEIELDSNYGIEIVGFKDVHEINGIDSLRAIFFYKALLKAGLDSNKVTGIKSSEKPNYMRTGNVLRNDYSKESYDGFEMNEINIYRLSKYIDEQELRKWNRCAILKINSRQKYGG